MSILFVIFLVMFGPPVLFFALGRDASKHEKSDRAKNLYIIGVVYLIVGLGICGALLKSI